MFSFDPTAYGGACAELLQGVEPPELGPGRPRPEMRERLERVDREALFEGRPVRDEAMASCCVAGLWLLHDFLDQSHRISQSVKTPSGSYWHGIMHRREPDFPNAKYWFRRVGDHPVFDRLASAAQQIAAEHSGDDWAEQVAPGGAWDPFAFVDQCEAAHAGGGDAALCRQLALAEWQLLFDHCYRQAVGP